MARKKINKEEYTSEDFDDLVYPEVCRRRVGMYLGDESQSGYNHSFDEVIDNSIDEGKAGYGDKIIIKLNTKTQLMSVRDFGRGIPFDKRKQDGVSGMVHVMTTLHSGGKTNNKNKDSAYTFSGGTNGVGASVVNAVSDHFFIQSFKKTKTGKATFSAGIETIPFVEEKNINKEADGTYVEWKLSVKKNEFDEDGVFEQNCKIDIEYIKNKLTILNSLNVGMEFELHIDDEVTIYERKDNIGQILDLITDDEKKDNKLLLDTIVLQDTIYFALDKNNTNQKKTFYKSEFDLLSVKEQQKYQVLPTIINLAFNYTQKPKPKKFLFGNGVKIAGSTAEKAFKDQFSKTVNSFFGTAKKDANYDIQDIMNNLSYVISVDVQTPKFAGQTKDRIGNPEALTSTERLLEDNLDAWINRLTKEQTDLLKTILDLSKTARESYDKTLKNSQKAFTKLKTEEVNKAKSKLEDCLSKNPDLNELYIVEGDSASGGIRLSRSALYQAFIALKGKPLNVILKKNKEKIFTNDEIRSLVITLGGMGNKFDIEKLKYRKIILLADADLDGYHISALMLSFFFEYYPELIKKGYIYIALSPLYKITKGENIIWALNDAELEEKTKGWDKKSYEMTRNKGLGEMNPEELFETTLNPKNRTFVQVQMDDFDRTSENINIYMSDSKKGKEALKAIIDEYYQVNAEDKHIIDLSKGNPDKFNREDLYNLR